MDVYIVIGANNWINKRGFKTIEEAHECVCNWLNDHIEYFTREEIIRGLLELEKEKTIAHFGDVEIRVMEIIVD